MKPVARWPLGHVTSAPRAAGAATSVRSLPSGSTLGCARRTHIQPRAPRQWATPTRADR